jgi:glycolate oxidase FAD binding subunit
MGRSDAVPLHDPAAPKTSVVAKISVLPTQIAEVCETLATLASESSAHFNAVFYAIGIGTIHFATAPNDVAATMKAVREKIEALGGSLVITHRPDATPQLDAWGNAGDALALMRAVKREFDPKSTLNPGRFVGGT